MTAITHEDRHQYVLKTMRKKFTALILYSIGSHKVAEIEYAPSDEREVLDMLAKAGFKIDFMGIDY